MLKLIQSFFNAYFRQPKQDDDVFKVERVVRLATAALFMEIARADFEISDHEHGRVLTLPHEQFDLARGEAEDLAVLGEQEIHEHSSLYPFARLINDTFSIKQKRAVVENFWRIAYADKDLHKYEEYFIRKHKRPVARVAQSDDVRKTPRGRSAG